MTMQEIGEKNTEELRKVVSELRESIRSHRFRVSVQQETNVRARRDMRRTIARILTELHTRQLQTEVTT